MRCARPARAPPFASHTRPAHAATAYAHRTDPAPPPPPRPSPRRSRSAPPLTCRVHAMCAGVTGGAIEAAEVVNGGLWRLGGDGRTRADYPGAREAAAVAWRRGGACVSWACGPPGCV